MNLIYKALHTGALLKQKYPTCGVVLVDDCYLSPCRKRIFRRGSSSILNPSLQSKLVSQSLLTIWQVDIHARWAAFEETTADADKAASILESLEKAHPELVSLQLRRINLERRR